MTTLIRLSPSRHDEVSPALRRWARARRRIEHEQLLRDLLAELRRLREELRSLRLTLHGRAA